ncbi:hypothetical protein BU25DRAFT_194904 [Macroventuria anomochaeta]|uniref:Uncharacterized protein n=1 Tax=Macroventuria anomochaeta TaxID=301207 RepID=A0ACB6SEC4_9PLEO|nr:uncharacterized protein BU25DRAFT_194904 [Macroventuria anomochaeta]KAF2631688.1 hypothetical protein BU25DRAFT_194904 [Macroventuria anomochaeta]
MQAGTVSANHGNPRKSRLGMPKLPPLPVLPKSKYAASPAAMSSTKAVQAEYAWPPQNSTACQEPCFWPPRLARHTRSPGHHAAGTLPASGTREGTTPEKETHFSYAYMSRPFIASLKHRHVVPPTTKSPHYLSYTVQSSLCSRTGRPLHVGVQHQQDQRLVQIVQMTYSGSAIFFSACAYMRTCPTSTTQISRISIYARRCVSLWLEPAFSPVTRNRSSRRS